jgi:hypothetical protein
MRFSKKKLLYLIESNINEMAMDFPNTLKYSVKNPNFDPSRDVDPDDNPEYLSDKAEKNFTERPHSNVTRDLSTQNTPMKKVPMPAPQGGQNFSEKLASEAYANLIRRVKQATHYTGNGNLISIMYDALTKVERAESAHRPELEKLAVETVFKLYKIPEGQMNVHAKLISVNDIGDIPKDDFAQPQPDDTHPEAPSVEDEPVQNVAPQVQHRAVEDDYVDKLENFNLERAKRRLINAMTQGAAHTAYTLYSYFKNEIRRVIGPLPNNADIMDLYALMMSINDTNYWHFDNGTIKSLEGSVAGKAMVQFPKVGKSGDDEEELGGGDDEEGGEEGQEGDNVDTIGQPIDPSIPQVFVTGINFPVLFHEVIKGVQKVVAAAGMDFPGYDPENPRHDAFLSKIRDYEDVLEYELWDLRLGPAIWSRFLAAHPDFVIDPEQKMELQHWVQHYIYSLPARKFLSLMKEIMAGTDRAKAIVSTLVSAIEKMFSDQEYEDVMSQYENEVDDIDNENSDDDLSKLLGGIPGIRLSDDEDDYDDEDDEDSIYR